MKHAFLNISSDIHDFSFDAIVNHVYNCVIMSPEEDGDYICMTCIYGSHPVMKILELRSRRTINYKDCFNANDVNSFQLVKFEF